MLQSCTWGKNACILHYHISKASHTTKQLWHYSPFTDRRTPSTASFGKLKTGNKLTNWQIIRNLVQIGVHKPNQIIQEHIQLTQEQTMRRSILLITGWPLIWFTSASQSDIKDRIWYNYSKNVQPIDNYKVFKKKQLKGSFNRKSFTFVRLLRDGHKLGRLEMTEIIQIIARRKDFSTVPSRSQPWQKLDSDWPTYEVTWVRHWPRDLCGENEAQKSLHRNVTVVCATVLDWG